MVKDTEDKNLHSGHRKRVRADVCEKGFSTLQDHKFLELVLFYAIPQADTNELAHRLLQEFGSLKDVFNGDIERLKKVKGVGENTAVLLASFGEASRRMSKGVFSKRKSYKTTDDYMELAVSALSGEKAENVVIFCFDAGGKLKKQAVLTVGDEKSTFIDVRKAVTIAIDSGASKAVIAHNHPQGSCEPSASDIDSTRNLSVMFRKLGFFLADHIVVGEDNTAYSMYSNPTLRGMFF